ncbi:MAG: J domain-containing protein [Caldilinea sp.]|nr:J domain-containing protein [Caldilinea sp.]MDW8439890.1 J domain-containing protein [Caldilineaceae bacterium]
MTTSSTPPIDPYAVLGVSDTASDEEIRRRYRFLALAFHPDRYQRNPEHYTLAEQHMKRLNEAYRVLSDPNSRAAFDGAQRLSARYGRPSASLYSHTFQEMAQAMQRVQQLEQELASLRAKLAQSDLTAETLQAKVAQMEKVHAEERSLFDAEQNRLRQQLEERMREYAETERTLRNQMERAERKIERLSREIERKNALIERLKHAKAEWETASQHRVVQLTHRIERLYTELEERERRLIEEVVKRERLQRTMEQERRNTQHAAQLYSSALAFSETEAARLQIELESLQAGQRHSGTSIRLWQIAAVVGVVNTVILLTLAWYWLRHG